ncbi:MAG: polyprenyl synthetase family protein [Bulleidia sp.]
MNFEELLEQAIQRVTPSRTRDAMEYSLMSGGKRLRPMFLYDTLAGYGLDPERGNEFAVALELIQTYSLIHDDLPAMDNDDLRRGMPSCHKQFDEATAILAGDGLLTYAFEVAAESREPAACVARSIGILSRMAGPSGMVYGQCLDTTEEDQVHSWDDLRKVHRYKTGCLFSAPFMIAAVISGRDDATIEAWHKVGDTIGLAFQVQDDIMDATETAEELGKSNSDARNEKVTSVSLLGMEKAESLMEQLYGSGCEQIRQMSEFESDALIRRLEGMQKRRK